MKNSAISDSSILNENSYETHLSMESRMREIRTSGLTRGRTSAVIGNASHPVAFSLLYSCQYARYRVLDDTRGFKSDLMNKVVVVEGVFRCSFATDHRGKLRELRREALRVVRKRRKIDRVLSGFKTASAFLQVEVQRYRFAIITFQRLPCAEAQGAADAGLTLRDGVCGCLAAACPNRGRCVRVLDHGNGV